MKQSSPEIRLRNCLVALAVDLETCESIGISHPDSPMLAQELNRAGGLARVVCAICQNSCMLQLEAANVTGVKLMSTYLAVQGDCKIYHAP